MVDQTVRVNFTVPASTKSRWKAIAEQEGITLSALIRRALTDDETNSEAIK